MKATLIVALLEIAYHAWKRLAAGDDGEDIKRDVRDRADVAMDSAIAKRALKARKAGG